MQTSRSRPTPVVKWAGGKRQMLQLLEERMPQRYGTYYEPFFGGGALFFDVQPEHAVLNDINDQLINMYQQIRTDVNRITVHLLEWQNIYNSFSTDESKSMFYMRQRRIYNNCLDQNAHTAFSAALLIFLNKSGFNGLYRINHSGQYNVPSGHKETLNIINQGNLRLVADSLQNAELCSMDFEQACQTAKEGDFIFFDSPYYHTFDTYQAGGFSVKEHERLAGLFRRLTDKNIFCMATNNACEEIRTLYHGFSIETIPVRRMINRDASHRTGTEVIIRNYTDDGHIIY